jgi:hypothetical protein
MKKISLAVIGFFFQLFSVFAQTNNTEDTTNGYKPRKLNIEEVNFVSGYYHQDGNNSAVTGGIGTENLTDFANTLDVILLKTDKRNRQYTWTVELGLDHYTSASSDNIDPNTTSGPSAHDTRFYPSVSWAEKDTKGNTFGLAGSFSTEFDYKSYGIGLNYSKTSKDNNRDFAIHLQSYFDRWTVIYPVELRPPGGGFSGHGGGSLDPVSNTYEPRTSHSASLSYSQVITKRLQMAALLDIVYQQGLLATDYQRVFFNNNTERIENLPDKRMKTPIGLRANYFIDDRFIIRAYYRYYQDDWGIKAHTVSIELPIKLSAYTSLSPFYRYYTQNAADYFAPYGMHGVAETFYTSDYDLSQFSSSFFGAGIRLAPENGIFRIKHWTTLEIRYGHYTRSNGLHSDIVSLNAAFK